VIHQNLLKRRADDDGLSASAVERDYVLAHTLAAISERDRQARIVFKGGTALRLWRQAEGPFAPIFHDFRNPEQPVDWLGG